MAEGPLGRGQEVVIRVLLQCVWLLCNLQPTKSRLGGLQDTLRLWVLVSKQDLQTGRTVTATVTALVTALITVGDNSHRNSDCNSDSSDSNSDDTRDSDAQLTAISNDNSYSNNDDASDSTIVTHVLVQSYSMCVSQKQRWQK